MFDMFRREWSLARQKYTQKIRTAMKKEEVKGLAEGAVQKARDSGATFAEARVQSTWGRQFVLKNGEPQPSYFAEGYGIGIRVIAGGALGFAATNEMKTGSVWAIARKAVELAKASGDILERPIRFDSSKPSKKKWAAAETEKIEGADAPWLRGVLEEIESRIEGEKAGVKLPGRLLYLGAELEERFYVNSDGARVEGRLPRVGFFGSLTAMEGAETAQRFMQLGETGGLEVVKRIGLLEKVEDEARTMGKVLREAGKSPTDMVDVVLSPELSGIAAHESVGHPQEADRVLGRE